MFATAHHPCKYLSNPMTRNMRKNKKTFVLNYILIDLELILREREYFGRTLSVKQLPSSDLYQRMNMRLKVIAHKASVYCIAFDRTGNYALSVKMIKYKKIFVYVFLLRVLMIFF